MDFDTLWNRDNEFEFAFNGEVQIRYCRYGKGFAAWGETLIEQVSQNPTDIAVNLAILQLCQRYWSWFVSVPRSHQNHIGTRDDHVCIFQVYRDAYFKLHALALALTPPRLFEVPAPVQPAEPQQLTPILFLGEEDEDEG